MVWSAFNIYFILYTSLYKLFYYSTFSLLTIFHSRITRPTHHHIFTDHVLNIASWVVFADRPWIFKYLLNNIFPDKQSFVCHSLTVYLLPKYRSLPNIFFPEETMLSRWQLSCRQPTLLMAPFHIRKEGQAHKKLWRGFETYGRTAHTHTHTHSPPPTCSCLCKVLA